MLTVDFGPDSPRPGGSDIGPGATAATDRSATRLSAVGPEERIHETWLSSDRIIPSRFVRPVLRFTEVEAAGGVVLLVAAVAALVWANGPFGDSYTSFWNIHVDINIGEFHLSETLQELVNDGLMAIFFFVVGLEIKRELVVGELRDPKHAALPAVAALGGMVVPALVYVAFVAGTGGEALRGWGIPMATDIAFSIGVLALLGTRVPVGAKLFLLALAIADDIGAIAVIAIFYTDELRGTWMLAALVGLVAVYAAQKIGIRATGFYVVLGFFVWFATLESGVHATIAGVTLGLMTPAFALYSDSDYHRRATWLLSRYDMESAAPRSAERLDNQALSLATIAKESVPPLNRLEHVLHPWSSFVIVPLFALANAGVVFEGVELGDALTHPVTLGIALGLVVGKTAGITLFTWLGLRLGIGRLPARTNMHMIAGLAMLAGIGFTVSLFITELAFTGEAITDLAKIGIFIGSGVAGIAGYFYLRASVPPPPPPTPDSSTAVTEEDEDMVSAESGTQT